MSARSAFEPGTPLRGGVPVCFPWFGPHPEGAGPLHGFARIVPWTLTEAREEGQDVVLVLTLTDADVPADLAAAWPYPFRARMTVTVGATLTLALEVTNTGPEPLTFQEALHTYLAVADVRAVTVRGPRGSPYLDRLAGAEATGPEGEPLLHRRRDRPGLRHSPRRSASWTRPAAGPWRSWPRAPPTPSSGTRDSEGRGHG